MKSLPPLAFVDLETSGLSPRSDRITEIGVVTADASDVAEWSTLIHPGERNLEHSRLFGGLPSEVVAAAPRFRAIAAGLRERLAGRLFIAHNARFDFAFLQAEFLRAGIDFQPQALCSVMLSRKLYPAFASHDLDTLMVRHGLQAEIRHRALPDARLVWQFWQILQAEHPPERIAGAIASLLEGPVLPVHLDASLIDRLPEAPGVYVMRGDGDAVLQVGKAANLKRHFINYFRLDRASGKAAAMAHRVRNITWQTTQGAIGARLRLQALARTMSAVPARRAAKVFYSWRLLPGSLPCVELFCRSDRGEDAAESYGLFDSARKARNALRELASTRNLCHAALGLRDAAATICTGCVLNDVASCGSRKARLQEFTKIVVAFGPWRCGKWPFDGPIGVKERSDLHIIEDWRYVGTARGEQEIHQVLENRRDEFDRELFVFLAKTLPRLARKRIVRLPRRLLFD